MQKSSKHKTKLILVTTFFLILLLAPIRLTYKDGGTTTYNAVLYKVIVWKILDRNETSGYLKGWEFHFFPNNFHDLGYYKNITFPDQNSEPIQDEESVDMNSNSMPFKSA